MCARSPSAFRFRVIPSEVEGPRIFFSARVIAEFDIARPRAMRCQAYQRMVTTT
jgi:hypothetical protein